MNKTALGVGIGIAITASIVGVYAVYFPSDFSIKSGDTSQTQNEFSLRDEFNVIVEKKSDQESQITQSQFSLSDKLDVTIESNKTKEENSTGNRHIVIEIIESVGYIAP